MSAWTVQLVCPGGGRRWGSGTGAPICPVCHRGPRGMGAPRPVRRDGRFQGTVPEHERPAPDRKETR